MGTAMAHVSRTRTALLLALFSCLVASCSKTPDSTEQRTAPSSEELAAKIASLAEVSADFDQVRSILVARGGELVYENYYGTDADAYRDVAVGHQERDLDADRDRHRRWVHRRRR